MLEKELLFIKIWIVIFYNERDMEDKGYNSNITEGVGIGIIILSLAFGYRGCNNPTENMIKMERLKRGYILQEADIIGGPEKDKFYIINGNIAIVEEDGNKLVKKLNK